MANPILFALIFLVSLSECLLAGNFISCKGAKLYDSYGTEVRFTGVNWFGFETSNLAPHGVWARDYKSVIKQIKDLGFNCVRIPFCDKIFDPSAESKSITFYGKDPYTQIDSMNKELNGLKPLQVLDKVIEACEAYGLKVILDNHSRDPDGYMNEHVWYTSSCPEEKWIANWVALAKRYKGRDAVVACDLDNEPHGTATWGANVATTDWNKAAERCGNAILAENPDLLIIVEGVEKCNGTAYWWGGNLTGVKTNPIVLSKTDKLFYSFHEYGPEVFQQEWFTASDFPTNLPAIWEKYFGFIHSSNTSPLFCGEFGIKEASSFEGKAGVWFDEFLKYCGTKISWTYWCFNPNSGDTGGLLKYDWLSVEQWKVDKLVKYQAPLIKNGALKTLPDKKVNTDQKYLTVKSIDTRAGGIIRISYQSTSERMVAFNLYDLHGALIASKSVLSKSGHNAIDFSGKGNSSFAPGAYCFQVVSEGQQSSMLFLVTQ